MTTITLFVALAWLGMAVATAAHVIIGGQDQDHWADADVTDRACRILLVAFVVAPLAPMLVIGRAALEIAPERHAKRREPQ